METKLAYFDETGDDGLKGSDFFILTGIYMSTAAWKDNYNRIMKMRGFLKKEYGFHIKREMHTRDFLLNKHPYKDYAWSQKERIAIVRKFILCIGELDIKAINVIIDKTIIKKDDYPVLENALKYNIQRIENDSNGKWNYILISDKGRIAPMRRTARKICIFNPISSKISGDFKDSPIQNLVEDVFEKDSAESVFIQFADFISYFVHLYFKVLRKGGSFPSRINPLVDETFIIGAMNYFKTKGVFNLDAHKDDEYGLVIYPKQ